MAEKTINNPSLLPGDLEIELSGGSIIAISGHPLIGSGGGTQSDYVYYPDFDDTTGNIEFKLGTIYNPPSPIGGWHISGATGPQGIQGEQGIQGIQGIPGVDGKNPVFEIDSNNAHWKWKYAEATSGWTDLGVVASGAVGPKGQDGTNGVTPGVRINTTTNKWEIAADGTTWVPTDVNATGPAGQNGTNGTNGTDGKDGKDGKDGTDGKDGVSPTVSTSTIQGGTEVTFTYGTGQSESITVLNGTPGAAGASGYSPEITLEPAESSSYPKGGTKVTITDLEHQAGQEFYVWNGTDGQGATVNLLEGTGIKIEKAGQDYTIGVSGDYASTSVVEAASANALSEAESWVGLQGFLKSSDLTDYATKTYANDASANALSEAETWVGQRGYATETYVETASANAYDKAVAQIPSVANFITKDVNNLTYYYTTSETSSTSEITNALSTKLDSTVAAQTYQTKADMSNYLTTSDASTTYQPKGNYASASDITDMATKTWVGQQGFITKNVDDLTYYYKKTETSAASELTTEFAKFVQKTAVKTGTYGNVTEVSAIGDVPIKDTKFWAIDGTYESNNSYQHYIENTNTFNYYTVMVHPANTTSAASWANDNIIHIILE